MAKWADYLLISVSYAPDGSTISQVIVRPDLDHDVGPSEIWSRPRLVGALRDGLTVVTARKHIDGRWALGEPVLITDEVEDHLVTPQSRTRRDSFSALPEVRVNHAT